MNRRDFIKISGTGLLTLFLSGCGITALMGNEEHKDKAAAAANTVSGGNNMRIVVLTGSPHKAGTSALLADKFIEGAQAAGHQVYRFNSAFEDTHPCLGCDFCGMNGPCVHKDAIEQNLMAQLVEADLIVLITPLYYYGMSAQIKTVIDRFYARTGRLHRKKSIIMATAYNSSDWTMDSLLAHYEALVRYMEWEDVGRVMAIGCGSRPVIERTNFPDQAYQLGLNL